MDLTHQEINLVNSLIFFMNLLCESFASSEGFFIPIKSTKLVQLYGGVASVYGD